jgi:hypothetical protein
MSCFLKWNYSLRIDMSLHSDTLFWFRANPSFSLMVLFSREAANTNFIVFVLTDRGLNQRSTAQLK